MAPSATSIRHEDDTNGRMSQLADIVHSTRIKRCKGCAQLAREARR
jgi:predicted transcriptional regulator